MWFSMLVVYDIHLMYASQLLSNRHLSIDLGKKMESSRRVLSHLIY